MASTITFTNKPNETSAGEATDFSFEIDLEDKVTSVSTPASVDITAQLYVDNTAVSSTSTRATENDIVQGILTHTFEESEGNTGYPRPVSGIRVEVELDYFFPAGTEEDVSGVPERNRELGFKPYTQSTSTESIEVTKPEEEEREVVSFGRDAEPSGRNTLGSTFQNRTPFAIRAIEYEDDATYLGSVYNEDTERTDSGFQIGFSDRFNNPTVSIDTAGRFVKHEIVGGATVRQKIGEDPINISINGVCKRRTANQIDSLRDAKSGKIFSDRLPGNSDALRVQFGSTNTEPLTDGGAADIVDGNYLYSFQINAIEVIR